MVRPVMDLMQTMPAFVWLVPVVSLFGLDIAAGVVATVIFALPPGVRLTELGIRQVDAEVVEAGHAFGATPRQILREVQLPLAMPTVMAGVNQVIMLALSMAVIAGLVGAGGLGGAVTTSISRLDVGLGFEAGLSVVVLAIFLDRVTAGAGGRKPGQGRLRSLLVRATGRRTPAEAAPAAEVVADAEPVRVG
ncbi:ABC transporter permease subunit [Nocardioides sp. TF02-7]|uniref:ABC transporter permease n=1 Tax=Nocardioides sp. TF02-7 TaxID=2917724 RepID=UPI001F05C1B8|nr:ABC transporter permease subunit [Nocardioides sp. TF02-7]UMG93598.1 ABC transporter permease subunit [Nocardioides sp. TF02-7]